MKVQGTREKRKISFKEQTICKKHNYECRPEVTGNALVLKGEFNSPCSMLFPPNSRIFIEIFNLGVEESPDNFVLLDGLPIPYQTPLEIQVSYII